MAHCLAWTEYAVRMKGKERRKRKIGRKERKERGFLGKGLFIGL